MGNSNIVLHLKGTINTNYSGLKKLFEFYYSAKDYYNETIYVDFYQLNWFDANLTAVFGAILHHLENQNNLTFSADFNFIKNKFNVLFRNGFLFSDEFIIEDEQQSTISYQNFSPKDEAGFVYYIQEDLLQHRGMPNLNPLQKNKICDALIEVFNNIQLHSKVNDDFFVCGQYYPSKNFLIFTIIDLGIGFYPAIKEKTLGTIDEVFNDYDAIVWSLKKGNSTKKNCPGGLALYDLYNYFKESQGNFHIITGDTYWSIDLEQTQIKRQIFEMPFKGSILNLCFNCQS